MKNAGTSGGRRALLGALAGAMLCASAAAQTPATSPAAPAMAAPFDLRLPFTYTPDLCTRPVVSVSINESRPLLFVLDTGANALVVRPEIARELGIKAEAKRRVMGRVVGQAWAQTVRLMAGPKAGLTLREERKGEQFKGIPLLLADVGPLKNDIAGGEIAGVIGIAVLPAQTIIRFDPARGVLDIGLGPHAPYRPNGATVAPFRVQDALAFVTARLPRDPARPDTAGKPFEMVVDTGSDGTVLGSDLLDGASLAAEAPAAQDIVSFNTTLPGRAVLVASLVVGETPAPLVPAVAVRNPSEPYGTLGMSFLARYRFTLDYAHHELILEPGPDAAHPPLPGRPLVWIKSEKKWLVVERIAEDLKKRFPDLRVGDRLVSVDHYTAEAGHESAFQRAIIGSAGTPATLVLFHKADEGKGNAAHFTVTYTRPPLFADPGVPKPAPGGP